MFQQNHHHASVHLHLAGLPLKRRYTAEPILHRQGHTALFVRFALSLFSEGDRRQLRAVPAFGERS
tara:strand:+ start:314 stop:511 length:198 start_codon:yes stop_codon:yes gene_type:complete